MERVKRGCEHANPSSSPSPVVAQLGTTNQILSFSCVSLSASVTSCGFIAAKGQSCNGRGEDTKRAPPGMSCLLANTNSSDSFISRSLMMRCNSCLASSIRTLSEESITKIRPWVPVLRVSFPCYLLFGSCPSQRSRACPASCIPPPSSLGIRRKRQTNH